MHFWIAKKYAQEACGVDITSGNPPSKEDMEIYSAALLLTSSADGELNPAEMDWIMGHQASFGTPPEVMGEADNGVLLSKYTLEELIAKFDTSPTLKYTKRCLVFHCISACSADSDLAESERKAIDQVALALHLTIDDVDELLELHTAQQALNEQIISTLWKDGSGYEDK
jgi:uncharacterized membrane protein YebE (DUF533 family)